MNQEPRVGLSPASAGAPVASFELIDHDERAVTVRSFAGSFLLVYFGFTHCKVVCPRSLAKLARVLTALDSEADRIAPLYITVDPARDTPDRMRQYLADNRYPFTGLTGSAERIDAAKKAFRVFAARQTSDSADDYEVPHTAIAYLMAPDGTYLDHFADTVVEETIIERIKRHLERASEERT